MDVYLVRHGETPLNAARILQFPDTPLSERGATQAELVGLRLAALGIRRILTSDYARARATAEAIHAASGAPVEIDPLLRERHFGIHRGCAYDELEVNIFASDYDPPGGESPSAFDARIRDAWAAVRAAASSHGPVAVVSHGLVCRILARDHLVMADSVNAWAAGWANTSVTEIEATPGPKWRAVRLACAAHLESLDSPSPSSLGCV